MKRHARRIIEKNLSDSCESNFYKDIQERVKKQMETNPDYFSNLSNKKLYNLIENTTILDIKLKYLNEGEN